MTDLPDDGAQEVLEEFAEQLKTAEQQRPEREQYERKGRVRNKYRLLEKWTKTLEEFDGPGDAELVDGYRPGGLVAPADVSEIAGLVVWDADGRAHHFRVHRNETVNFIESPEDPKALICIDPMVDPAGDNTVYLTDGPPSAVTDRLDALDLTPRWEGACRDGAHSFEYVNEGEPAYEFLACEKCDVSRSTLSWLGHAVPAPGGDGDR